MQKQEKDVTAAMIYDDVCEIIDPVIEMFSDEDNILALASVLYETAIEMGGAKRPIYCPDGMIDGKALVDFAEFVGNTATSLRLLKSIIKKEVRIHYINNEILFSQREVKNRTGSHGKIEDDS